MSFEGGIGGVYLGAVGAGVLVDNILQDPSFPFLEGQVLSFLYLQHIAEHLHHFLLLLMGFLDIFLQGQGEGLKMSKLLFPVVAINSICLKS